ncbi:MurR/RpiR family transcriptional regulator [Spiroplasma diminutum]|uniref:RpiR family transcriptional regulator n=1 Tax=Spiroplasma diminutum CUAS-1 TaxID=1276221 RepID=S5M2E9_9MOLU|nr:MurR/RpiR family transcriptional regulator [Spiroplasma diminutum]AGR42252.1 RpiR family transcriptional regulator [Spiroplasma diminutum CUAS-1]
MKKSAYVFLLKNKDNNLLLKNIYELHSNKIDLNIEELAKISFLSKSSISRYFKKNGFDGFSEFKFLLTNEQPEEVLINNNFNLFEHQMIFKPIENTANLNQIKDFEKIHDLLLKANYNFILGAGANASVCYELKSRLDRFGYSAETNKDLHGLYARISNAKENDLLWVFSYTGETEELVKIVTLAKKRNLNIISITKKSNNTIEKLSSIKLYIDDSENLIRTLSIKSRMSMFYLISKLVLYIYSKDIKYYNQKLLDSLYK